MSLKEILDGLPDLTDEERTRLQEELDAFSPDHERAWAKIAEERLRSIRAGKKQAISAEEFSPKRGIRSVNDSGVVVVRNCP